MPYTFQCAKGHAQGTWGDHERAAAERAGRDPEHDLKRCHCGRRRKLQRYALRTPNMIPDVQPHYSDAFAGEVRSRRHLKELQGIHGTQDFEPQGHMKDFLAESRAKVLHGAR